MNARFFFLYAEVPLYYRYVLSNKIIKLLNYLTYTRKYTDFSSVDRNPFLCSICASYAKAALLTIPSDPRVCSAFLSLLRYVHQSVCNTIFGIQFSRRATRN